MQIEKKKREHIEVGGGFLQYLKKKLGNELWVRVVGHELQPWSQGAHIPPLCLIDRSG